MTVALMRLLPRLDSNQGELNQNQSCCRLHHGARCVYGPPTCCLARVRTWTGRTKIAGAASYTTRQKWPPRELNPHARWAPEFESGASSKFRQGAGVND